MTDGGLPEAVSRFLALHITSIEQLEVLLLLRRTHDREWNAAQVNRELGSSAASIQGRLADLAARGFLSCRGADNDLFYRYAPANEETLRQINGLAQAYKERRLSVINFIYGRPRSDIQSFADAFTLVKRDEED